MKTFLNTVFTLSFALYFCQYSAAQGKRETFDYQAFDWNTAYQSQSISGYYKEDGNKVDIKKVKGSPYFATAFVPGEVRYKDKEAKNFQLRYNAFSDEIEVKEKPNTVNYQALLKTPDISATFLGNEYRYLPAFKKENGDQASGYLMVLHKGEKYTLYVQKRKEFREGREARTSFESGFPDKFVDEINYFIAEGSQTPVFFKPSKKALHEYAGSIDKKELKKFLKDQDLDPDKEEDLAEIFKYFETRS